MYNIADCISNFIPLLEVTQNNNISWQTVIIAVLPCLITSITFYLIHLSNKHTEQLKATDNFRFEIFKKKLNVYHQLNTLISNVFLLYASTDVYTDKKIEVTKAGLQLQEFISSNSMMISSEIGILLLTLLQQKQDTELTAKTINIITERMDTELCLGKSHKIKESSLSSLKDKHKTT